MPSIENCALKYLIYHKIYLENDAVNNKINPSVLKSVILNVNKNNPPEIENTIKNSIIDYKQKKILD